MKKTPLYENHCRLNGKMTEFGGWMLPVEYSGIIEEHQRVRNAAGLFDVSHMGEITVRGKDAETFVQRLVTNDISKAPEGKVVYSPMCYEDGGVVDDLIVYKYSNENYLLIVNAANTEKDFNWIKDNLKGRVEVADVSEDYAQLAIQGPKAQSVLQKVTDEPLDGIRFFCFKSGVAVGGTPAIVSRTGYTGEDGFEIYLPPEKAPQTWELLLEAGHDEGLLPAGLGARDTLRFEAALPLYGHELSKDISPLEAGLGSFVKLYKEDFIGLAALLKQNETGLTRIRVGFEMLDRGIPRNSYNVEAGGRQIGYVTSGSYSPTLGKNIGMALVETEYSALGSEFDIVIRNKPLRARVVGLPFYSKRYKK